MQRRREKESGRGKAHDWLNMGNTVLLTTISGGSYTAHDDVGRAISRCFYAVCGGVDRAQVGASMK